MNNILSEHYIDSIVELNRSEKMTIANEPAFPVPHEVIGKTDCGELQFASHYMPVHSGMTLRHWLAGLALQGVAANPHHYEESSIEKMAAESVKLADAVIAELSK